MQVSTQHKVNPILFSIITHQKLLRNFLTIKAYDTIKFSLSPTKISSFEALVFWVCWSTLKFGTRCLSCSPLSSLLLVLFLITQFPYWSVLAEVIKFESF